MAVSQTLQDELCHKLGAVGLPEHLRVQLVGQVIRQVSAEGPENVVRRLKVLKQAAVNTLAGQPVSLPWIAHTADGPKGVWKPIWRWLKSQKHRTRVRALNTVMVYASIVLPKQADPTLTQEKKFLESVEVSEPERARRTIRVQTAVRCDRNLRDAAMHLKEVLKLAGWKPDTSRDLPEILEFLGRRYGVEPKEIAKSERVMQLFMGREQFYPFHSFPQVLQVLGEVGQDMFDLTHPWNGRHLDWRTVQPPTDLAIGVVGYSQEPGAKLRAFASPNWVLQAATEGMKQCLLSALDRCPWDCTHEQLKGVQGVQRWLSEGRKVFAVDLSDATNNFPLLLQLGVLRVLGIPEEDVRLLELISRSPYQLTWGERKLVTWNVGQPLGAGPSFMSFALAHATVAIAAEISAGVSRENLGRSFYILGDDIVISDEEVHRRYRGYLDVLGCPVSESKCLVSTVAGEFAGKLITRDHVYHGYKYRDISDISFLDVLRNLGPQALSVLSAPQRAYAELVWEIPEPYGLGFNPSGRPYAERYAEYLHLVEALEQAKPDTNTLRPQEIVAKMVHGFKSRVWRYFPISRWKDLPYSSPASTPRGDSEVTRERIMEMVRRSDRLVSRTAKSGDPRVSPIEGWTTKVLTGIKPLIDRSRNRAMALPR